MSASTVNVTNISSQTEEKEVKDFFSFCGKITSIEIKTEGETKSAVVKFEKETAAKTALLLDNTQLGATQVQVSSPSGSSDDDGSHYQAHDSDSDELTQEVKPRSRIFAEYLAHGYAVSDVAIQKAIDLDQTHGITDRFLTTLSNLDKKLAATDKAKAVDQSYAITPKANSLLSGLTSYYEKAVSTPAGQKIVDFYTQTSRQVIDIHNEARRLADIKRQDGTLPLPGSERTACECGSDSSKCPCEPGKCTCATCPKSKTESVAGTNKTTCGCGGQVSQCACETDRCACNDCPKSSKENVAGTNKTKCSCGGNEGNCACEAGKCACSGCDK